MKIFSYFLTVCAAIGIFLLFNAGVFACGPLPTTYIYSPGAINNYHLMRGYGSFLGGNYGIIMPAWGPEYAYPVYQDLMGKKIAPNIKDALLEYYQNQNGTSPTKNNGADGSSPVDQWLQARRLVAQDDVAIKTDVCADWQCYENCLGDSFLTAAQALKDRLNVYTKEEMKTWIEGQDAVFSECFRSVSRNGRGPDQTVFKASLYDAAGKGDGGIGNFFRDFFSGIGNFFSRAGQWLYGLFNWNPENALIVAPTSSTSDNGEPAAGATAPSIKNFTLSEHADLLKYDKEYQDAAKLFYGGNYDGAIEKFKSIESNLKNPWAAYAAVAVGRAYIRKGNEDIYGENGYVGSYQKVDNGNFSRAKEQFRTILDNPDFAALHAAARVLFDYVNVRIDPRQRLIDAATYLENPVNPTEAIRNLDDFSLVWYYTLNLYPMDQSGDVWDNESFARESENDFIQWYYVWTSPKDNFEFALNKYQQTKSLPWLLACLKSVPRDSASRNDIVAAAEKIPSNSGAYDSVRYYLLRLDPDTEKARQKADAILEKLSGAASDDLIDYNFFNDARMSVAANLEDAAKHSDRAVVAYINPWISGVLVDDGKIGTKSIDPKLRQLFNESVPLQEWAQIAAKAPFFSAEANRYFQSVAFARAVMLGDWEIASGMAQLLSAGDAKMKIDLADYLAAKSDPDREFAAVLFMIQYTKLEKDLNNFADDYLIEDIPLTANDHYYGYWWRERENNYGANKEKPDATLVGVVSPPDLETADRENQTINAIVPVNYFCDVVTKYGAAHPADSRIPEALAQAVIGTRYANFKDGQTLEFSKKAFTLLHNNYPASDWAKQTPYWYGN